MLDKIKDSAMKGVTSLSVKSEALLEINRLRTQISNLQSQIEAGKADMANVLYVLWLREEDPTFVWREHCERIARCEKQIDELQRRIDDVKREAEEKSRSLDWMTCSACGAQNRTAYRFCCQCGAVLCPKSEADRL